MSEYKETNNNIVEEKPANRFINLIPWIIVLLAVISISSVLNPPPINRLNYNEFDALIERGIITEVSVSVENVVVDVHGTYRERNEAIAFASRIPNTEAEMNNLVKRLQSKGAVVTIINPYESNPFVDALLQIVPFLLFGGFAFFLLTKTSKKEEEAQRRREEMFINKVVDGVVENMQHK